MKKTITILLACIMMLMPLSVFAEEQSVPQEQTSTASEQVTAETGNNADLLSLPVIYSVKSKTFVSNVSKVFQKNWLPSYQYASSYNMVVGWECTSSLTISASTEIKNAVTGSGSFTTSRTYTCSVAATIPADSSRLSTLAHYRDYKKYNAVIQCQAGVDPPYVIGTYEVLEPAAATYNLVRYQ